MDSIKCQSCGLVNFGEAEECKRCKEPLVVVPSATHSKTSLASKKQSPADRTPGNPSNSTSSDSKALLKILPNVIFGVPLFLVLKDRMFGPPVKVGGYTDTLQLSVLVGCTIGLIITAIVIVLSRKR